MTSKLDYHLTSFISCFSGKDQYVQINNVKSDNEESVIGCIVFLIYI